ncbi:MAG: hypothetical protein ABIN18_05655 [Pseudomonadota bacterium]
MSQKKVKQKKTNSKGQWETLYPIDIRTDHRGTFVRRSDVDDEDWQRIDPSKLVDSRKSKSKGKFYKAIGR